ncbi:hypothetical protein IW140_002896 [Coemansia sp. RSA 1813]|nr:hypothetical protein EV178_002816 [Coemansia sp. RSA 1646]KAJ1771999.1 hypothetical protein LPJ74_001891 [Coemansia sp. RSA 1843]KAJ2089771.1 hypothetical protein IW138_003227 [Coemansia sp. RSA 986]KAJ2210514.1 hypothetical protein EV179_006193 [Coemansia sp. RSA 487]KAJ2569642.1 hypothetical protein IW140_002896 [Coemansia sp. RSA 1813]
MSPKEKPTTTSSTNSRPATTAAIPPREPYPWRRALFGVLVVFVCWGIGIHREYPDAVNTRLKTAQHYLFSRLWTVLSGHNNERLLPFRETLWAQVHGNVLELGPGYADALTLLKKPTSHYVALEPNMFLHPKLAENARKNGFAVHYDPDTCPHSTKEPLPPGSNKMPPQQLAIVNGTLDKGIPQYVADHAPYDYVITSLVLCSVDSLQANLDAIQALLKPGGKYVFIEHVHHTDEEDLTLDADSSADKMDVAWWKGVQSFVSRFVWPVTGNCHFDRDTGIMLKAMSGWSSVDFKTSRKAASIETKMTPLIYGTATKSVY